jgi:hypothetical protein
LYQYLCIKAEVSGVKDKQGVGKVGATKVATRITSSEERERKERAAALLDQKLHHPIIDLNLTGIQGGLFIE